MGQHRGRLATFPNHSTRLHMSKRGTIGVAWTNSKSAGKRSFQKQPVRRRRHACLSTPNAPFLTSP